MVTRSDVVNEARKWKDTPWRHMGRNTNGIDCVGLPVMIAKALGIFHYDVKGYAREPANLDMLKHFRANMIEYPVVEAKAGDVIIFRDGKFPFHVGIIGDKYDDLSLIHAYAGRRKVIEEMYYPEWFNRALACFAFPGLEDE